MTDIKEYPGFMPCDKYDPQIIDAYVEIKLDPQNPTGIILDSSWGEVRLDLKSLIKAGETVTRLELAPETNPTVVRFLREDGEYDCITGDELSRIISLQLLKDVDQNTAPTDGVVYQFDSQTNLFKPFDLKSFVTETNTAISRLQTAVRNLTNRISDIEQLLPFYPEDKTTKIARGTINLYSDNTNTNNKTDGLFTHDKSTDVVNDEFFA